MVNNLFTIIKKFILGQYSLSTTFWKVYVLGVVLLTILTNTGIYVLALTFLVFFIFICLIGIWKSSGFYLEKNKNKKSILWGYTARVWVILTLIFMWKGFFFNSEKFQKMGFSDEESVLIAIVTGATEDLLSFFYLYNPPKTAGKEYDLYYKIQEAIDKDKQNLFKNNSK